MKMINPDYFFTVFHQCRTEKFVDWPQPVKTFLFLMAGFIAFLLANSLFLSGFSHVLSTQKKILDSLQEKLSQQQRVVDQAAAIVALNHNNLAVVLLSFTDVISYVETTAKEKAIKMISIKPPVQSGRSSDFPQSESLQLLLSGRYAGLFGFIASITDSPLNISIKDFVVEKSEVSDVKNAPLQLTADLNFYTTTHE